ncbi:MAG: VWA domain-containing protein [Proteobacteria bacterium]|nr:VWA domain-containing protein [Pseudomonadota bacterium]
MNDAARELAYAIPWRTSGVRVGAHKSYLSGSGGLFRDIVPLTVFPDPRRIAVRASLSDPFERLLVRRAEQPSSIDVVVLVDVSPSMAFEGRGNKMAIAADVAEALAIFTERTGDTFALLPFDSKLRHDLVLWKTLSRAAHLDAIDRLRRSRAERKGSEGIADAGAVIAGSRKLVFIVSDFLWSDAETRMAVEALAFHDVVPIELRDSLEIEDLPSWGLLNLRDLESGRHRLVAMRPSLKEQWLTLRNERRDRITRVLDANAREMFTIRDSIDWTRLTAYLLYGIA